MFKTERMAQERNLESPTNCRIEVKAMWWWIKIQMTKAETLIHLGSLRPHSERSFFRAGLVIHGHLGRPGLERLTSSPPGPGSRRSTFQGAPVASGNTPMTSGGFMRTCQDLGMQDICPGAPHLMKLSTVRTRHPLVLRRYCDAERHSVQVSYRAIRL